MDDRHALVILGMHRSGTSSVAGALSMLGAAAPRTLMAPGDDNPRGFWESRVIMELNDRILAAGGSNWRDWRAFSLDAHGLEPFRDEAVQLLEQEFGGQDLIVLKDPRICRCFPFWRAVLEEAGYAPRIVSPVRSPLETAASLIARNAMGREEAVRLWLRHVLDAEAASRGLARRILLWEDFLIDWRGELARVEVRTGLDLSLDDAARTARVDDFLSADLRRQRPDDGRTPVLAARAHTLLKALAHGGESPATHTRFDELRQAFDQACGLFADAPR